MEVLHLTCFAGVFLESSCEQVPLTILLHGKLFIGLDWKIRDILFANPFVAFLLVIALQNKCERLHPQ